MSSQLVIGSAPILGRSFAAEPLEFHGTQVQWVVQAPILDLKFPQEGLSESNDLASGYESPIVEDVLKKDSSAQESDLDERARDSKQVWDRSFWSSSICLIGFATACAVIGIRAESMVVLVGVVAGLLVAMLLTQQGLSVEKSVFKRGCLLTASFVLLFEVANVLKELIK